MPASRLVLAVPIIAAAIPVAAVAALFASSELRLREYESPAPFAREVPTDLAARSRGERLARTRGCHGCHGERFEGKDWSDEWPGLGRVIAVNLSRYAQENPPEVFERALRHGIGRDGRALWSMPSYNFRHLTDDDVLALLAYIRAHPVMGDTLTRPSHSLEVRWDLAFGGGTHMPEWVAAVPPLATSAERDGPEVVRGEYLAMTSCNECHGLDVRGAYGPIGPATPDLAIVAGYTPAEFRALMRRGVSKDGRSEMRLMSGTARTRFVHFTDQEVDDLYAYLRTLPGRPIAAGVFWRGGD